MIQAQVRLYLSLKSNLYQKFHRLKPKSLLCCCGSVAYHHPLRLKPYLDLRKRKRRDWNSMSNSEGYESDAPEELTAEQVRLGLLLCLCLKLILRKQTECDVVSWLVLVTGNTTRPGNTKSSEG